MSLAQKGIDVRQTGTALVFRVFLQSSAGAKVTTGTTTLALYELESDGTLKSYDFNDNTFKATALTTATGGMTHQTGNNGTVNTGLWTYALNTVSGFTAGGIYFAQVNNAGASPTDQTREFQYGGADGDLAVTSTGTGTADLNAAPDWAHVLNPTSTVGLTNTAISTTQVVASVTGQLTAAQIATGVWQDATAGDFTVASSVGKSLYTSGNAPGAASGLALVGSNVGTATSVSGAVGSVTGNVGGNVVGSVGSVAGNVGGNVTGSVASVGTGGINASTFAAGAINNAALNADTGLKSVRDGTAQAGASTTITLDAGASLADGYYVGLLVVTTGGTGPGQARTITGYAGSTKVATVDYPWSSDPDNTTTFSLLPSGAPALNASLQVVASSVQGNVTGSVATVAGDVVGSVSGSVNSVVSVVSANVTQWAGDAAGIAVDANHLPKVDAFAVGDKAGYSLAVAPPTAAQVASQVWQDPTSSADFQAAGSIGLLLATDIDAAISTRLASGSYAAPPAVAQIAAGVWQDATAGDFAIAGSPGHVLVLQLGGAFTGTGSAYTAAALANAPGGGGSVTVGGYAAGQDPATLVLDAPASSHDLANTVGAKINSAGGAADPLASQVPGGYASGTAGYVLGKFAGAQVNYVGPVNPATGVISLVVGDTYSHADGTGLDFVDAANAWPDLAGATAAFTLFFPYAAQTFAGSIPVFTGAGKTVRLELTSTQTAAFTPGRSIAWKATATLAGGQQITLVAGTLSVGLT